ncbi:MAG: hypothetical protein JSV44_09330, partial [Candidatus Zixiibacteriota bacterium]
MTGTSAKIAAIIILVGLLIALSVIKSIVSANRQETEIASFKNEYSATRDSMYLSRLADSTRFYLDSILCVERFYQAQIDSLNCLYDSLKKIKAAKSPKKPTASKKNEPRIDETAQKVMSLYRRMLNQLPKDLTAYEKRIALKEITVSISQKYKISPDS